MSKLEALQAHICKIDTNGVAKTVFRYNGEYIISRWITPEEVDEYKAEGFLVDIFDHPTKPIRVTRVLYENLHGSGPRHILQYILEDV